VTTASVAPASPNDDFEDRYSGSLSRRFAIVKRDWLKSLDSAGVEHRIQRVARR